MEPTIIKATRWSSEKEALKAEILTDCQDTEVVTPDGVILTGDERLIALDAFATEAAEAIVADRPIKGILKLQAEGK